MPELGVVVSVNWSRKPYEVQKLVIYYYYYYFIWACLLFVNYVVQVVGVQALNRYNAPFVFDIYFIHRLVVIAPHFIDYCYYYYN